MVRKHSWLAQQWRAGTELRWWYWCDWRLGSSHVSSDLFVFTSVVTGKQANLDDRRFSGRLPFLAYTGGIAWRRVQEVGV